MPVLHIDHVTRLNIAQAILQSTEGFRIIPLPDGNMLLMLSYCGHVSFDLVSDEADLFNKHLMIDVSALVQADLESHREPERLG